ncbi:MAG TPA: TadE/TadG family type IV pilus assembly protein [Terriglobales bacterium]|nr:TadE/TadG family type IV pilus assembly protein [Terriglobales bacterium]
MRSTQWQSRERGTQIVEMAVALPLLLFMALVVIEGASLVRTHQVLNNAAREGARFSIILTNKDNPATGFNGTNAIKDRVVAYAAANGVTITRSNVTINQCALITSPSGLTYSTSLVVVQLNYTLRYLPRIPFTSAPTTVPLAGRAQFRNFYGCN